MKLSGKLTITRTQSNRADDRIRIELIDADARTAFAVAEVTPEEFALAVTGMAYRPCALELRNLDRVGTVHEHKTELVPFSGQRFASDLSAHPEAKAALEPFEVDGWLGSLGDLFNGRNRVRGSEGEPDRYRVGFDRWVPRSGDGGGAA